jgi:hypothetical protein
MSTDGLTGGLVRSPLRDRTAAARIWWVSAMTPAAVSRLRFAFGITLAVAVTYGFSWQLSYLVPLFVVQFLGPAATRPTLSSGLRVVACIGGSVSLGLLICRVLVPYPILCMVGLGLVLFQIFYFNTGGASAFFVVWLLIAATLIPFVGTQSLPLAVEIAKSLVLVGVAAILVAWFAFALFPHSSVRGGAGAAKGSSPPGSANLSRQDRFRSAALSTLVVLPVLGVFFTLQWTDALVTLVFIAILAQQPSLTTGIRGGLTLVLGNLAGGFAAILFYHLLVAVPTYGFLIALTLLAALLVSDRLFSDRPMAPIYGMAFSTLLLLVGSATASSGDEVDERFYSRIAQIVAAAVYIVGALALLEQLWKPRKHES